MKTVFVLLAYTLPTNQLSYFVTIIMYILCHRIKKRLLLSVFKPKPNNQLIVQVLKVNFIITLIQIKCQADLKGRSEPESLHGWEYGEKYEPFRLRNKKNTVKEDDAKKKEY